MSKNDNQKNRYIARWARTKKAVELLGGKCSRCDETHLAVLSFHHLDPDQKDQDVSTLITRSDWSAIELEIKKCVLLCENCHRKEHFNKDKFDKCYEEICLLASGVRYKQIIKIKRWSPEDTKQLIELYNETTTAEISSIMQRMPATIKNRIKRLLAEGELTQRDETKIHPKKRVTITEELKKQIKEMTELYFTPLEIADKTGVSISTIFRIRSS